MQEFSSSHLNLAHVTNKSDTQISGPRYFTKWKSTRMPLPTVLCEISLVGFVLDGAEEWRLEFIPFAPIPTNVKGPAQEDL
jgi:hypothetical protein